MKKLLIITSFTLTAVSFLTSFTNSEKVSQERNCQYGQCIKIKKRRVPMPKLCTTRKLLLLVTPLRYLHWKNKKSID